jgi:S1-C subfamily serine protease
MGIEGLLVIDVLPGSNAEAAGIRGTRQEEGRIIYGDIITSINEEQVATYEDLMNALNNYSVGDKVSLGLIRDGKANRRNIVLEAAE